MTYKKRNISTFKSRGIDLYERYERIMYFMRRNSGVGGFEHKINLNKYFIDNYHKNHKDKFEYEWAIKNIDKNIQACESAKEKQISLTHQVLKDMSEGNINNITKGIWLSYPYIKYDYHIDENHDKYFKLRLYTGEEFEAVQYWREYDDSRRRYDYFHQHWTIKKPIHKQYYGKIVLLKKIN